MIRSFAPALACAVLIAGVAQAKAQKHPRLHQAVFEMRQAHKELDSAGYDFGGHRAEALRSLQAAYEQTELALKAVGEPYEGFEPPPNLYGPYANYPHLRHAKVEMGEAKKALEEAVGLFGGHRLKAIADIKLAQAQVEACIANAR